MHNSLSVQLILNVLQDWQVLRNFGQLGVSIVHNQSTQNTQNLSTQSAAVWRIQTLFPLRALYPGCYHKGFG